MNTMDNLEKKAVQHVLNLLKKIDTQPSYNLVRMSIIGENNYDQQRDVMTQLSECNQQNISIYVREATEWLNEVLK